MAAPSMLVSHRAGKVGKPRPKAISNADPRSWAIMVPVIVLGASTAASPPPPAGAIAAVVYALFVEVFITVP